jgi:GTP-binding protein
LGNWHFRTATNQAPRYAQPGEPAQERTVIMQLKVLADVGLVGFPNAGKSTLLSVVSAAKPEIADYPFTTLTPQLGIVSYRDGRSFCMADIPGIIEGASEGKGLGLRFLRHIERNSLLLFMVPGDTDDIKREYEILLNELRQFNPDMLDKHRVLAITKCDLLDDELIEMLRETLPDDLPCVFISAVANKGLDELKDVLWRELNAESNKLAAVMAEDTLVHRDKDMTRFAEEMAEEGEDEDIEYVDVDDIDDLDDLEYLEEEDD